MVVVLGELFYAGAKEHSSALRCVGQRVITPRTFTLYAEGILEIKGMNSRGPGSVSSLQHCRGYGHRSTGITGPYGLN
jgi:hypothetical protein